MPLGPRELILGVVVPALAAFVILFVARRAWLRRARDPNSPVTSEPAERVEYQSRDVQWREYVQSIGAWGGPIAVGIAWAIAFPVVAGTFNVIPPRESMSYLFLAAIACAIGGLIDSRAHVREEDGSIGLRIAGVFVLAVACAAGVLRFKFRSDWTPGHASAMLVAIGAICLVWWLAMDSSERDPESSSAMPWIAWMICVTISITLMMNGSIKYGQLALALASAAGAGLLLTLVAKRRVFLRGTAIVFAIVPALIIISSYYLFELKPIYVGLLLSAPITIALGRIIPTEHIRSSVRGLLRIAPTALLMAVILTIVVRDFRARQAERDPDDPYAMTTSGLTSGLSKVSRQPTGTGLAYILL